MIGPVDRTKFFTGYRGTFGPLNQQQVDGLNFLLGALERDDKVEDLRWAAYMLATAKWETGDTFQPVRERGSRAYFIQRYGSQTRVGKILGNDTPEEGALYAGVGHTQNTGENNAEMLERVLPQEYPEVIARWEAAHGRKFDLTVGDQPDDADDFLHLMDPEISYCAMSVAMRKGLYTGVGLPKYINARGCDYLHSRRIINGLDQASRIAVFAVAFERILLDATVKVV